MKERRVKLVKQQKLIPFNCFTNLEAIGKGGYGIVYQALCKDKKFALKFFHSSNEEVVFQEASNYLISN
jgi:serine/threonine protein kinase